MRELQKVIGYRFKNEELLKKALTHRSSVRNKNDSNERLEFLGDAVLELIVTEYLIDKYRNTDEGRLSKIRAATVNTEVLSSIATRLEMYRYIFVGKSEQKEGIMYNRSILENTFEALVGAIYLDGGLDDARGFVISQLSDTIDKIVETGMIFDHKTYLQELTQKRFSCLPEYKIIKELGVEHNKTFHCEVFIDGVSYGKGVGKSKKEAEKEAAKKAIERIEKRDV